MIKVVLPSSFNFDQQVMSLVDVHSKGVDHSWLKKTAAVLTKELSEIRPDPNFTFVHLIALGDQEKTGFNRNGDGFPRATNETRHDTFVKHANWYHNHRNKPARGDKVYGHVKASAYNKPMGRVELIVAIDNKKDPDSIEKLARGEDIPVSMACKEDYDVCSYCGHKAKTEAEHCKHVKEACAQMTDDGQFIGMVNPPEANITFFDISKVHRNADRIAFSLRKVAGHGQVTLSTDLARMYGITEPAELVKDGKFHRRLDLLRKLAKLEKEIEGEIKEKKVAERAKMQAKAQPQEQKAISERYVAIHQPERIAIIDTVKEELVADGFKDNGSAQIGAKMLNNQEKILTSLGS